MRAILLIASYLLIIEGAAQDDFQKSGAAYTTKILPILQSRCIDCHDTETSKGELDLERFQTIADVRTDPGVWQKVVEQLENGEMPPKDKKQLSELQHDGLLAWTKGYLREEALAGAGDPGQVLLRRLSNAEYTYTVRDLTSVQSLDPVREFPVDSAAGEGFTNTGSALVMSPALLEKYLKAGKDIASHAVLLPDGFRFSPTNSRRDWSNDILARIRSFYAEKLGSDGVDLSYRSEVGSARPQDVRDGRIDITPYIEAIIRRDDNIAPNQKYLSILKNALLSEKDPSPILANLRTQLRDARPEDASAIVASVRRWQDTLWTFNRVGSLAPDRQWQEPANPVQPVMNLRYQPKSVAAATTLTLTSTALIGSGHVLWEQPRIERPGATPLLMRDLRGAMAVLQRTPEPSAQQTPLEYFTQKTENIGGQPKFQGWTLPGVGDLSFLGNGSDDTIQIPGEAPPHSILVHPRPERWVAATWKSPISGKVEINAVVRDRHANCGNGVAWRLEHQSNSLTSGLVANGQAADIPPLKNIQIKAGDSISLFIGARDREHTCDLTEIDLSVKSVDGKSWSLSRDCADSILEGNPHADSHGNPNIWHFHTGMEDGSANSIPSVDWTNLAAQATAEDLKNSSLGPDPALFDNDGNLRLKTGEDFQFTIPASFMQGSAFVADGKVEGDTSVQLWLRHDTPDTLPVITSSAEKLQRAFDDFRELFPAAMCYARLVPIDEVVTLYLYHREDDQLSRLMLSEEEAVTLDRMWDELHYVSQDAFQVVISLEQILEFATQDGDPKYFDPMLAPVAKAAADLRKRLVETEPAQINALIDFAALAYRRPISKQEESGLRNLYRQLRADDLSHDEAFRLTLAKLFTTPAFLYKQESPPPGVKQRPVTSTELASRLSFFLAASTPDAELCAAALKNPTTLVEQAQRLRQHPNIRRMAIEFACQWLHIRNFDTFDEKSEAHFPDFEKLRPAMYEEAVLFFTDIFQNDRSILSILDADYKHVNPELANFYGLKIPQDSDWVRADSDRGGVLSLAAVLAKQSGASRTSPILRGNWVYETLLGERLPRPPAGIPPLPEAVPAGLSERQLIERHASDPACAKCHKRIDPYGFALEQFDAIGRFRTNGSDGLPLNTKSTLADGHSIEGMTGLRDYLLGERRDVVLRQFCRKLLGYALGRSTTLSDEPLLDDIISALEEDGFRFSIALEKIILSPQFREIRGAQHPIKQ